YDSAGTVEFVAGQDKSFYFLEMNTRLQVEHPVTELITGIDLVEQMIRVADGEKLPFGQKDIKLDGWSVESRVYAEDPYRGFLPSTGRLKRFQAPAEGSQDGVTVRVDTGVEDGGEISIYYDPMIAKLVTHAPTRIEAIEAMGKALDAFYVDGIQHNIPFVSALMEHPRWRSGELSTGFIAEEYPDGFAARDVDVETGRVLAAVAATIDHIHNERRRLMDQQIAAGEIKFAKRRVVKFESMQTPVSVSGEMPDFTVAFLENDGQGIELHSHWVPGMPVWSGTVDGDAVNVQVRPILNGFHLSYRGVATKVYVYTEYEAKLAALMPYKEPPDTSKFLLCPMPGLVVSINVEEGQEVKAGEILAVVEAMKMENVLRAERDGTVSQINVKAGDSLAVDAVIMEFA
ncbi:MAG: biotin/lipoyl-binding protein, partial [Rhodobiaceae bacterium]|nr:biotin/lipoyl-binding protein [Rhodobiaceae bacterium]